MFSLFAGDDSLVFFEGYCILTISRLRSQHLWDAKVEEIHFLVRSRTGEKYGFKFKVGSQLSKVWQLRVECFQPWEKGLISLLYHWSFCSPSSRPVTGVTALPHLSKGAPYKIHLKSRERSYITSPTSTYNIQMLQKVLQSIFSLVPSTTGCTTCHPGGLWIARDHGQTTKATKSPWVLPKRPLPNKPKSTNPADGQMLSSETNTQGCWYFSIELHLRDQPKISVNHSIISARKAFLGPAFMRAGW